jgi:protein-tyrosine-phosphatase
MLVVRIVPVLVIPRRRERVKRVLFVCTANTYRSPMAQAISDTLAEDEGLRFRAENAVAALEEAGIYPGLHSARW